jgi:hypothetical protein
MATVTLTRDPAGGFGLGVTWETLTTTNADGAAWAVQDFRDISIQVQGTFGTGGTLTWEGTNEATPANWFALTDPQGNALAITGAKVEQVMENTRWMRPRVTAGDGTTDLDVIVWAGRTR